MPNNNNTALQFDPANDRGLLYEYDDEGGLVSTTELTPEEFLRQAVADYFGHLGLFERERNRIVAVNEERISDADFVGNALFPAIAAIARGPGTPEEKIQTIRAAVGDRPDIIDVLLRYELAYDATGIVTTIWPDYQEIIRNYEDPSEPAPVPADHVANATPTQGVGPVPGQPDPDRTGKRGTTESDAPDRDGDAPDTLREAGNVAPAGDGKGGDHAPRGDTTTDETGGGTGTGTADSAQGDSKIGGDLVILFSGQLLHQVTDLAVPGRGLSFEFTRTYLNGVLYKGPLGYNWDHTYNLWLREEQRMLPDGSLQNVVYRSTGTLREDRYVQVTDYPVTDPDPLGNWPDAEFNPPPGVFDRLTKTSGRYVLETIDGLQYYYNADRLVDYIVDPNDNEMTFEYDDMLRLKRVTDPVGKRFEFRYDAMNRLRSVRDVVGDRRVAFYYTDNGDLMEVDHYFDPDFAAGTDYRYTGPDVPLDLQHNLTQIINPLGEAVLDTKYGVHEHEWGYNRVVHQRSADGEFRYEYKQASGEAIDATVAEVNRPRWHTCVTHPNGHPVMHWFNQQGNVVRRREGATIDGVATTLESTYAYNEDGLVVEETFADGSRTEYVYGRERYEDLHGETADDATPEERRAFGLLQRLVRYPRPGRGAEERIITDYGWADPGSGPGLRLESVYGPYYADVQGNELPNQVVRELAYKYDPDGNLKRVVFPDVNQPNGTTVTPVPVEYSYTVTGLIKSVVAGTLETAYHYFGDDRRSGFIERVVEDPHGIARTTAFETDDLGRITRTTGPYGAVVDTEWTSFDTPRTVTLPAGRPGQARPVATYEYNRNRELTVAVEERLGSDGTPHPNGVLANRYRYDGYGRLVKHTRGPEKAPDPESRAVVFTPSGRQGRTTDWDGSTTRIEYDERELPIRVTQAAGTIDESTVEYRYDAGEALIQCVDGRGAKTTLEYDASGQVVRRLLYGPPPSGGPAVRWSETGYAFDALGRAIEVTEHQFRPGSGGPERTLTTGYFFDAAGRLDRVVDPTGAAMAFEYDALGRLTRTVDPDGNDLRLAYDDARPGVDATGRYVGLDAAGDPVTQVTRTSTTFDSRLFPVLFTDGAGNTVEHAYDSAGHLVETREPGGTVTQLERNLLGRPRSVTETGDGLESTTAFVYDTGGNLRRLTDPIGNVVDFEYDALGRVTRLSRGDRSETLAYDEAGNPIRYTDENGVNVHREYSPGGRLRVETPDDSSLVPVGGHPDYLVRTGPSTFTYTPSGQIASATNDAGNVQFEYDSLGRLLKDRSNGVAVAMGYDDAGRLTELTYPDGRVLMYGYTAGGYLTTISQTDAGGSYPGLASAPAARKLLAVDRVGERASRLNLGDVAAVTYQYNTRRLPVGADWTRPDGTAIFPERRLFDPDGACAFEQLDTRSHRPEFDGLGRQVFSEYRKDVPTLDVSSLTPPTSTAGLGAVDQEDETALVPPPAGSPNRTVTYDLDANANRDATTETDVSGATTTVDYRIDPYNRYKSVAGRAFTYDRAGNLLDDGIWTYQYDAYSRLAAASQRGETTSFEYDAMGRLVEMDRDGTASRFVYARARPIEWRSPGTTGPAGQLVPVGPRFCHLATDGTEYVPLHDLGGTVHGFLGPNGDVDAWRTYDAFGAVLSQQGDWPAPVGFRGYLEDADVDLNLLFARALDPETGRFLQRDPAGFVDGTNLYTYAGHAPISSTDQLGFTTSEVNWGRVASEGTATAFYDFGLAVPGSPEVPPIGTGTGSEGGAGAAELGTRRGAGEVPGGDTLDAIERLGQMGAAAGATIVEKYIWTRDWSTRGFLLEDLAGNNLGKTAPLADYADGTTVRQIKSTNSRNLRYIRNFTRKAAQDALKFITQSGGQHAEKTAQALMVMPTGTSRSVVNAARNALGGSRPINATVRVVTGLPGKVGMAFRGLGWAGGPLSAFLLYRDVERGDVAAGIGSGAGVGSFGLTLGAKGLGYAGYGTAAAGATTGAAVIGAFGLGYGVGTLVNSQLSEDTQMAIGGTINEIVNGGGWKLLFSNPFGVGMW